MEFFHTRMFFIFYLFLTGLITCSHGVTVIVDGVTQWKNPTVTLGDSIIFRDKYHSILYIYKTRSAFDLCNFTQATILTNPKSTSYTWRASRLGYFYFSFNPCNSATKLTINVVQFQQPTTTTAAPAPSPKLEAPVPASGGVAWSSPDFPWPFLPHEKSGGPMNSPAPMIGAAMPPDGKEERFPFIDSSPAVPLPASEIDSGTVFHLPISAIANASQKMRMMSMVGYLILQCILIVNS